MGYTKNLKLKESFEREIKKIGEVDGPNVVTVYPTKVFRDMSEASSENFLDAVYEHFDLSMICGEEWVLQGPDAFLASKVCENLGMATEK